MRISDWSSDVCSSDLLALLRGNIGRPGAGVVPVRGHSNVQGDRNMGATSTVSNAWLDNLETAFPGLRVCRDSGRDAAGVLDGLLDGKVKSLLSLGGQDRKSTRLNSSH